VTVELINTGSELLFGKILNTHQQWLCRRLTDLGYSVIRQVAVPDTGESIEAAVRDGLSRADLVITTGGLGPTCDDLTRERIAALLQRPLHPDASVAENIARYFAGRRLTVPPRTRVETLVPEGAEVIPNHHGTAPGLAMTVDPNPFRPGGGVSRLVMLPGPPRELRPMFNELVVPLLSRWFPREEEFVCRTLKTTGIGESSMEERINDPLQPLVDAGMELGYCARVGEVDVRFVARGKGAAERVAEAEAITRRLVGSNVFGVEDDVLESVLVNEFRKRGLTLALAESCTGGHIANRITNISGASAVLLAGYVTYSNGSKVRDLGVQEATLTAHGAVSEETAIEMAAGARARAGTDYAIAVTGIAGPTGATANKPVGLVFMAVAGPGGVVAQRKVNAFDRETFKYLTAQQAMMMLWNTLHAAA
jgi:nicotinamide-nucleotide amidase